MVLTPEIGQDVFFVALQELGQVQLREGEAIYMQMNEWTIDYSSSPTKPHMKPSAKCIEIFLQNFHENSLKKETHRK